MTRNCLILLGCSSTEPPHSPSKSQWRGRHSSCIEMLCPNVTPEAPIEEQPTIGLIGMGAMGKMYAKCLSEGGWQKWVLALVLCDSEFTKYTRIHVCDLPSNYEALKATYEGMSIYVFHSACANWWIDARVICRWTRNHRPSRRPLRV